MMPCSSCIVQLLVLLAPIPRPWLQLLQLVKALCFFPSLFTIAADMPKLADIRTAWGTPARCRFLPRTQLLYILIQISFQANLSLKGSLKQVNPQGSIPANVIP